VNWFLCPKCLILKSVFYTAAQKLILPHMGYSAISEDTDVVTPGVELREEVIWASHGQSLVMHRTSHHA